jgi:hypothetical protein
VIDCNIQSKTLRPLLCMVFLGLRIFWWAIHLFAKPACKCGALLPTLYPYMLYVVLFTIDHCACSEWKLG